MDVKQNGNIEFIDGEGLYIPFTERTSEGVVVDISTSPRVFVFAGNRVDTIPNPSVATGRLLIVEPSDLNSVGYGGVMFSMFDEQGLVPISIWDGLLYRKGQP